MRELFLLVGAFLATRGSPHERGSHDDIHNGQINTRRHLCRPVAVVGGVHHRHERDIVALEHPARALKRVESAVVMQSLVRRFLARSLVLQVSCPLLGVTGPAQL